MGRRESNPGLEEAQRRIVEALRHQSPVLDLCGLGLTELPPEIGELTALTGLDLSGNRLATLPPEIGQLTALIKLDLSGNQLAALPSEIEQLTALTTLDLFDNRFAPLPTEIGELTTLTDLNLRSNQLATLPPEIGHLTALTRLDLTGNRLATLPLEIVRLRALTALFLPHNQLAALPPEIAQLRGLTTLDLSYNRLAALPPEIGQLRALTTLSLWGNQIAALPPEIGQLTALTELDLHHNQLAALPPEIGQLTALTELDLSGNQFAALPPEIGQLTALTELDLSANQFAALPPEIGQLTTLTTLDLSYNQLPTLPPEMRRLTNLKALYLHRNPALNLLPEVLGPRSMDVELAECVPAPPADILKFYFARQQAARLRPLNEAKVLLVGQGGVGKTSLVRRLVQGKKCSRREHATLGIQVSTWEIPGRRSAAPIRLNLWDFGGQEIMHATHQFFLTHRSLYLLVLDARQGEKEGNLQYWLRLIESFGGDAPVLVVINKCDGPTRLDLNESRLAADFPHVRAFMHTSCESGSGIGELRRRIGEEVRRLPHVFDELPESYFAIKADLVRRTEKDNFLGAEQYRALCREHKIEDEEDQDRLLRLLHDLGTVHTYDDPQLADVHVLNPEWITRGVYAILNAPGLQRSGILDLSKLGKILPAEQYPARQRAFIVGIMRRFELCFDIGEPAGGKVLIPELLSEIEPPGLEWNAAGAVRLEIHYRVLPSGLLPRFIVRTNHLLGASPIYWRAGVVLEVDGCRALIRGDTEAARAHICVIGPERRRRAALGVVRDHFRAIHATIARIDPREKVPVPDRPGLLADYETLLRLDASIDTYWPDGADRAYSVGELLDGIEDTARRARGNGHGPVPPTARGFSGGPEPDRPRPLQTFISYSHKDEKLREKLDTALSALKRRSVLDTWSDHKIGPGEEVDSVIAAKLNAAEIVLLLVSANFIGSDYCYKRELRAAIERHEAGTARVIPVILRPTHGWQNEVFGKLKALPKDGKAVTKWSNRDEAWENVASGIEEAARTIRTRRRS